MAKGVYVRNEQQNAWADAPTERLRELIVADYTYSEIARTLNREFPGINATRNACTGKAMRAGFAQLRPFSSQRPQVPSKPKTEKKQTKVSRVPSFNTFTKRGPVFKAEPIDMTTPPDMTDAVRMIDATGTQCCYPVSGQGLDLMVCGKVSQHGSYCRYHDRLTHTDTPRLVKRKPERRVPTFAESV
jgi:hypothetical protein